MLLINCVGNPTVSSSAVVVSFNAVEVTGGNAYDITVTVTTHVSTTVMINGMRDSYYSDEQHFF